MALTTKQQTAIGMAIQESGYFQSIKQMRDSVNAYLTSNTDISPDTFWRAMQTAAVAADGSISVTPDNSPVLTNPIIVGGVDRAEADLLTGLTFMIEFEQFCAGTLPENRAAINRNPTIDLLAG